MTLKSPIADYLPQSMLIRLHPLLKVFHDDPSLDQFPSASAYGYFFHEFLHFLHNLSTASGLAGFGHTLQLWHHFRRTIGSDGFSAGENSDAELKSLLTWLIASRRLHTQKLSLRPASVTISSVAASKDVADPAGDFHALECDATVHDASGASERTILRIGTVEILECAAWLLEKRMVQALSPTERINPPPVFPYQVVGALASYVVPSIDDEVVIACVLGALQDADPPTALLTLLHATSDAIARNEQPMTVLRRLVEQNLQAAFRDIEHLIDHLEAQFPGQGVISRAVRTIAAAMRESFHKRLADPFFEFKIIHEVAAQRKSISQVVGSLPVCAILQINDGEEDRIGRDILLSSLGGETEEPLRVLHCLFDYVSRHLTAGGFVETARARRSKCPFFTCCALPLRRTNSAVCAQVPWEAAESPENGNDKACWYGTAVRVTRPPLPSSSSSLGDGTPASTTTAPK